eukprot:Skav204996  [mRNA]  locus=scaffold4368:50778:51008:- [translate_table: standard]
MCSNAALLCLCSSISTAFLCSALAIKSSDFRASAAHLSAFLSNSLFIFSNLGRSFSYFSLNGSALFSISLARDRRV